MAVAQTGFAGCDESVMGLSGNNADIATNRFCEPSAAQYRECAFEFRGLLSSRAQQHEQLKIFAAQIGRCSPFRRL
jgi:hypothetical protein